MDKKALSGGDVAVGAGLLLATALVASDLYRTRGSATDVRVMEDTFAGKISPLLHTAEYLAKVAPHVVLVNTPEKLATWYREETPAGIAEVEDPVAVMKLLQNSNNALAFRGKKEYIIGADKLPVEVIEHELGHLADFREKGIYTKGVGRGEYRTGILHALHQQISKDAYMKGMYAAEVAAWERAKETDNKAEIQRAALGTYEKAFHARRALVVGAVTALLGGAALERGVRTLAKVAEQPSALAPLISKEKAKALSHADSFFGEKDKGRKWEAFADEVSRKSFAKSLQGDPRADDKLRMHADRMNRLKTGKVIATSQGSKGTYDIVKLRGGGLGCTCNDWRYKRSVAPRDDMDCKHLTQFRVQGIPEPG